ncbi:MAG: transposase [Hungatella sp.]
MTAIQVLSEIGGDMSVFPSAKNLVSWAGCCPRNDQSNHCYLSYDPNRYLADTHRFKAIYTRRFY